MLDRDPHASRFVVYNVTYSVLENLTSSTADTIQPSAELFPNQVVCSRPRCFYTISRSSHIFHCQSYNAVNSTLFIALVDEKVTFTPANLTLINPHVVRLAFSLFPFPKLNFRLVLQIAGPAMYQAD